jgi:hypothetical protein
LLVDLFKRWRRSRSGQITDPVSPNTIVQPSVVSANSSGSSGPSSARARRPATMGRTTAEQAYLAQAANRAKQE